MCLHFKLSGAIGAITTLAMLGAPQFVMAAPSLPVLWTAGGLDAGTTSAGQAARMAVDPFGNVAIVSGPSNGRDLAVTSYTPDGAFRWRGSVSPSIGTFTGDWIAGAPDGDFVAVGRNLTSTGSPIAITVVRFAIDGGLLWRVDLARTRPSVARLVVDAVGSAYLAFNSAGDGQDIQLHKYSAFGQLLWSQVLTTGFAANDIATSLALSADGTDVVLTGDVAGGATWITASYQATTGVRRWLVIAPEGTAARDVVVDATRVYVTGQGVTGAGTPALAYWLTVISYDRSSGARLWRTDTKPDDAAEAAGLRIALAPDGGVVATGQAQRGFLDWYTVALDPSGTMRWRAVRDGKLNTDEIPRAILVLESGTAVVTGPGGPNLPGGFIPGVTVGYGTDGTLLWEVFSTLSTVWASALPSGDVCATGGYDAMITCWGVPPPPSPSPSPSPGGVSPDAPAELAATTVSRRAIQLIWKNGTISQTEIIVERCTGSGCADFAPVGTTGGTTTSFTDTGLTRGTTYVYRVRATNEFGASPYSNVVTARTKR